MAFCGNTCQQVFHQIKIALLKFVFAFLHISFPLQDRGNKNVRNQFGKEEYLLSSLNHPFTLNIKAYTSSFHSLVCVTLSIIHFEEKVIYICFL